MTTRPPCALPGCSKPVHASSDCGNRLPLTCGNLHHQLLMAMRFNRGSPNPFSPIVERNKAGYCALSSCHEPPYPDHSWCSYSHYECWLFDFTASLQADQFCKFDGCTRHVFVEENFTRSKFCGREHRQRYVMLSAMEHRSQLPPENLMPSSSSGSSVEVTYVPVSFAKKLMDTLRDYANNGRVPENIGVDEDFFYKHPWEARKEDLENFSIVRVIYTSKGKRQLKTKSGYHWKQQGPGIVKEGYVMKYFRYKTMKANQQDGCTNQYDLNETVFSMQEYTVKDVNDYSIIKLYKTTKKRRSLPATNMQDSWSVNVVMTHIDEGSLDSFIESLPPLLNDWDDSVVLPMQHTDFML
ncbi:hypothetical protein KP509_18G042800 [Ceratopteris richardii]|uniref:Uncharacterized protein n=1 Tax=Ceratopteris richardii TaxID=49495 RepID=A0A8T2SRA1_CERRI|nr:hypothetical protein KP509_18G042800 [Ceratopteris richardii]